MAAADLEADARPDDEVLDRARRQNFARSGERRDTSADVYRDAADITATAFDFARVQPDAYIEAERREVVAHCKGALDGARRAVERRQEPVARGPDLDATVPVELTTNGVVAANIALCAPES